MPRSAPFLALVLVIGAAALAIGADTPAAALFFAGLVCALCALFMLAYRGAVGGLALSGLVGAAALTVPALAKGWLATGAAEYATLVAAFGLFAVAQIAGRNAPTLETLWKATILVGALIAGASFIDFIIDPSTFWGIVERPYGGNRFSTPFLSANIAATFYGLIAILSAAELIRGVRRFGPGGRGAIEALSRTAIIPITGLLLNLTCVFLTASRGGSTLLAAALLGLVVWELFRGLPGGRKVDLRSAGSGLGAVALIAVVFLVSGDLYAERMLERGGQDSARATIFAAYWEAIPLAPLLGHGLGGFFFVSGFIAEADNARTIMYQGAAHNIAFQWLLQGGVVGLGFVLAISVSWLLLMRRGLMRRNSQSGFVRAAVVAALFVTAHGMVDYALEIPAFLFLFAWVCGLGAGVATGGSRPLTPSRGKAVSRTITLTAVGILLGASALSFYGFFDRASARTILAMEDPAFVEVFAGPGSLGGSPVRLEAIGDRALALEEPHAAIAARAFDRARQGEPRDGVLEAKYAYARYIEAGFLPPDAAAALSRSYYRMPYGTREFAAWRLDFMEAVWGFLPERLKAAALREARVYGPPRRLERLSQAAQAS